MGQLLEQDAMQLRDAYRQIVKYRVDEAFERIANEKLTLRQISERNLFPEEWCYVLGYAKRRDDDALDNR